VVSPWTPRLKCPVKVTHLPPFGCPKSGSPRPIYEEPVIRRTCRYELGRNEGREEERGYEQRSDQGYDDSGFGDGGADGDFGDDAGGGGDF
jgi:hypothetical protein